ncbi:MULTISPECIES: IclR family transcriptional regulator [Paraburkholderia]|uniref:IclR family transcriptional regulator n=1 Tax=Paraburkholderia TaxID=1822464 RepID=UPI002253398D|nr:MULTISPECIES: IclR family transcriptional regulator [Paraburkholderia]MCX4162660.1 IclR family transcriptional regulator [Paraburkholderia megapolitana]MDN7158155.1 IclR family transcriptional regulator [Paraburkholderia sp. CHISQ3]MDQ6495202.1 IclR family transcriptional regulator [Paraburkholderia megapolitana]
MATTTHHDDPAPASIGAPGTGMLARAFAVLRALAGMQQDGARVTRLAKTVGLTQGTVHRILQTLIVEGMVEQDEQSKLYRLSVDFFALAAQAGNPNGLRTLCRPALLRLCASLGDTIFLLAKNGFDAVCVDLCEGPFPIRSFTGDIGGRVALGVGQGSLAILAFLPEAEREEIIRFNVPRIRGYGVLDEVYLRTEIERVRQLGYAGRSSGVLDGMAGVAVPVLDRNGIAVAALSVGTLASRLGDDRLPMVVELLRRQAETIGPQTNPFDAALRRPMQALAAVAVSERIG